jgi:hypothetical protein
MHEAGTQASSLQLLVALELEKSKWQKARKHK